MSRNSIAAATAATVEPNFSLSGSQRKTAYCLEMNTARMVAEAGEGRIGFLTLTVGKKVRGRFVQVHDAEEASRRFNSLASNLLRELFSRWVVVTERHKSGAIHFHLIVQCQTEIRAGFDWRAFKARRGYGRKATPELRHLWRVLLERLPSFGFGRAELTPLKSNGKAVSRYVSKYVGKNLRNRKLRDRRQRLVRYHGFEGTHLKGSDFCWASEGATRWRITVRFMAFAARGFTSPTQVAKSLGPRWAHRLTQHFDFDVFDTAHLSEIWRRMEETSWRTAQKTLYRPCNFDRPLREDERMDLLAQVARLEDEAEMNCHWGVASWESQCVSVR